MKNDNKVRTLFTDIGGVLLTDGWNREMRQRSADYFGLDFRAMDERHHLTFDTYEVGKISLDEYLRRVVFYEKRDFTIGDFREIMFEQSQPMPLMIDAVTELKKRYGLKVAVISNEGRELTEYRIGKFGLSGFVDFFISSCFVHLRKPDPEIFRLALDVAQVRPDEVVYIEDRPMFVQVAEVLGIKGIVHQGHSATMDFLERLGLGL